MNRIKNIKTKSSVKKNILLSSATAITLLSTSAITVLPNANSTNVDILVDKHEKKLDGQKSRIISNNPDNLDKLTNPNELIYTNKDINSTTTPVFDRTQQPPRIDVNLMLWKKLSANANNLEGTSSIKIELASLYEQINGHANLNSAILELEKLAESDKLIESNLEALKKQLIESSQYSLNMNEIPGVENVKDNMLKLSGITEGEMIETISSHQTFTKRDLLSDASNGVTDISINNIAGQDYTQLVKIAEIDPMQQGNYVLQFNYKPTAVSFASKGFLIIKNDTGQLTNPEIENNISKLVDNLDIFGRYELENGEIIGGENGVYPSFLNNFLIKKSVDGKFEILTRVKNGETLSNVKFLESVDLPDVPDLQKPSRFGILDVQATETESFVSVINHKMEGEKITLLTNGEIDDTNKVISSVQFFSNSLSSEITASESVLNNRTISFYQGLNTDFRMPLYIANKQTSDVPGKIFTYDTLNIYKNGVVQSQQNIELSTNTEAPTTISPSEYELYSDLKQILPDEVNGEIFLESSKISLKSSYDSSSKISHQSLTFSDNFYAIGRKKDGNWTSIDTKKTISDISIPDITQKIFFEKPKNYPTPEQPNKTIQTKESFISAKESLNEREVVIELLGKVYEEFSKPNSGDFDGKKFDLGTLNLWTASNSALTKSGYTNIKISQKQIAGSGNDIYVALNSNWKTLSSIMNSLFGTIHDVDRYSLEKNASATIVGSFLANSSNEFTSNTKEIENEIAKIVEMFSTENGSIGDVNYDLLSKDQKNQLADSMAKLIKLQFGTIFNEFSLRQYDPVYMELKKILTSSELKTYEVIKESQTILQVLGSTHKSGDIKLLSYKQNAWNEISTRQEVEISTSVKSMFDLLYFGNGEIRLGDSIFSSKDQSSAFSSLNSSDLVTFNSDSVFGKKDKVIIYSRILTFFGSSSFDLQNSIDKMLSSGNQLNLGFSLEQAFSTIMGNIVSKTPQRETSASISSIPIRTHYLDDVISGTNSIIALKWKADTIISSNPNKRIFLNSSTNNLNGDLLNKIEEILTTNPQADSTELSIWSNIINGTYDFTQYSQDLSGRNGFDSLNSVSNKLILDQTILSTRATITSPAVLAVEEVLNVLWWVILALVGVGVLVSSTVGLATKERQVKLSSRPVLKWLLFGAIVVALVISTLAILFGMFL